MILVKLKNQEIRKEFVLEFGNSWFICLVEVIENVDDILFNVNKNDIEQQNDGE